MPLDVLIALPILTQILVIPPAHHVLLEQPQMLALLHALPLPLNNKP